MADLNFGLLDTQMPSRIAAIPQQQEAQQAQNALQLMQLQHSMGQNELAKYQLSSAKRADTEAEQLRALYGGASAAGMTDPEFIRRVYAVNPTQGMALEKALAERATAGLTQKNLTSQISARDLESQYKAAEHAKENFSFLRAIPGGATDADIDAVVKDAAKSLGMQSAFRLGEELKKLSPADRNLAFDSLGLKADKRLELLSQKPTVMGNQAYQTNPNAPGFMTPFTNVPTIPQSAVGRAGADLAAAIARGALPAEVAALQAAVNAPLTTQQHGASRVAQGAAGLALRNREADPYGMFSPITAGGGAPTNALVPPQVRPPANAFVPGAAPTAPPAQGAAPKMTVADAFKNNVTGPEFVAVLPPTIKPLVESILRYDQRPPSPATKRGQQVLELVNQADPTYDAGKAQTRYVAKQVFVKGSVADGITAANTAINHMDTIARYGADLDNTDVRIVNAAKQAISAALGGDAPTSFDALRKIVGQEVVKAVVANGGSMKEREEAADAFSKANSPAQLAGVIKGYQELFGGRLVNTKLRYENDTGLKDFNAKLAPATIRAISGTAATPAAAKANPHAAKTDAEILRELRGP